MTGLFVFVLREGGGKGTVVCSDEKHQRMQHTPAMTKRTYHLSAFQCAMFRTSVHARAGLSRQLLRHVSRRLELVHKSSRRFDVGGAT